jgi:hypothetical protein
MNQQPFISEQVITEKTLEEILRNINKQVLETKHTLNLGQLLRVILDIKHYIFNPIPSKPTLLESVVTSVAIDHQMAIIQVQVRKNFIKDVLLDGGSGVNIIMEKLRVQLRLSKPKLAPYNLHMAIQTITKPLGLVKDLKTLVHGIPYVVTFIVV